MSYLPLLSALLPAVVLLGYIYWRDRNFALALLTQESLFQRADGWHVYRSISLGFAGRENISKINKAK